MAAAYSINSSIKSVHDRILKLNSEISQLEANYAFQNGQIESSMRYEAEIVKKLAIKEAEPARIRWGFKNDEAKWLEGELKRIRSRDVEKDRTQLRRIQAMIDERRLEKEKLEERQRQSIAENAARQAREEQVRNIPQPGAASAANGAENVKPKRKLIVAPRAPGAASAANEIEPGVLIVRPKGKPRVAPRAPEPGAGAGAANKTGGKRSNRRTRARRSKRSKRSKRRYRR
jgi:hypothetical protein